MKFLRASILLLLLPTPLLANTLHVDVDGADGGDCVSAPCRRLTFALFRAVAGDVIEVGPGRYDEVVDVKKSVVLRGAKAGVDARGRSTSGESVLLQMRLHAEGIVLDGFTIECSESCGDTIYAEPFAGGRIVNNIIRGGGIQAMLFGADERPSEVRYNEFVGEKLHSGNIGLPYKTWGLVISSGLDNKRAINVNVDSNRFTGNTEVMASMSNVDATPDGLRFTNNELVLATTGRGLELLGVDGVRVAGNTIIGGFDPAIRVSNCTNVQVTGNVIRGNRDTAVLTLNGGEGLRVEGNTFLDNMRALAITTDAEVHFNRFAGNGGDIQSLSPVSINAENNWFGCNEGPSRCGHLLVSETALIDVSPWLVMTLTASPGRIAPQRSSVVVADFTHNSDGEVVPGFPDGTIIDFSAAGGTVQPERSATSFGIAATTFTSEGIGEGWVTARLDQTESPVGILTTQPRRRATGN